MIKSLKALFPFVIVIAFLLTGCQASPEKGVVISKRDSANIGRNENSQILSDENQNSDTVKQMAQLIFCLIWMKTLTMRFFRFTR